MNRRGLTWIFIGGVSTPLGLLWLLQGADLIHVRPILCVANCQPLEGRSIGWMIVGALFLVFGVAAVAAGLQRRKRSV